MLEFKLQVYFEIYKDTSIISSTIFKDMFRKKHGDFPLLSELVVMIQKYQYLKYGELIGSGKRTIRLVKSGYYGNKENQRNRRRFGTKEERNQRKLEAAHK